MKKIVEFVEIVVHDNGAKLYFKVTQHKWKGKSTNGPVSHYNISKLEI